MAICHDCISRGSVSSGAGSGIGGGGGGGDCRIRLLRCRNSAGPFFLHLFLFGIFAFTLLGGFYFVKATLSYMNDNHNNKAAASVCPGGAAAPSGTPFSVTHVSINDMGKAEFIAQLLLQQKLAACVQIQSQMTSMYTWKEKIEKETEYLMIIKSRTSALDEMTKVIIANHPYEVAEVVSMPIIQGSPAYLKWLEEQVPDSKDSSG